MERHPIADAEVLNVLNLFLKRECYPILHEKYRGILIMKVFTFKEEIVLHN